MKPYNCCRVSVLILFLVGFSTNLLTSQIIHQSNFPETQMDKTLLIKSSGIVQKEWVNQARYEIRRRAVEINRMIISTTTVDIGNRLEIDLFDGAACLVKLNRVVVDVNNVLSMSGRIEGTQYGYFYLSTKDGICLGTIEVIEKQKKYFITYDRSSCSHYLTEVDPLRIQHFEHAPTLVSPDGD